MKRKIPFHFGKFLSSLCKRVEILFYETSFFFSKVGFGSSLSFIAFFGLSLSQSRYFSSAFLAVLDDFSGTDSGS
jgi:hypothetical protein